MEKSCDKRDKKTFTREAIIGLGEESFRKNYYPELQEKIIDLERSNAKLRDLVNRDTLTKMYNRHSFEEKLNQYTGKSVEKIAMISIDVNGLKFINDTIGHLSGDEIIVTTGQILIEVFEDNGYVARIGGDEFGIILDNIEESQVETMLERLNDKVEQCNLTSKKCGLSLAYGYSYHRDGVVNMEFMFQVADDNMYQNKLLKKGSIRSTFVKTFMKALEAKDYVSEGHVIRMENLAVLIGKALLLHQDQMDRLILLTKFHDIGKIGIPDSILKKPGKLTEDEWMVMRTHSSIGERIALEAAELKDIAPLILKHHEKWDGTGYPLGLAKEEIPMECRILAIVDTFDAMTNDRPYRGALTAKEAKEEICNCQGTQFDPELVKIFCAVQDRINT